MQNFQYISDIFIDSLVYDIAQYPSALLPTISRMDIIITKKALRIKDFSSTERIKKEDRKNNKLSFCFCSCSFSCFLILFLFSVYVQVNILFSIFVAVSVKVSFVFKFLAVLVLGILVLCWFFTSFYEQGFNGSISRGRKICKYLKKKIICLVSKLCLTKIGYLMLKFVNCLLRTTLIHIFGL